MTTIKVLAVVFIGFAGGIAVGIGFVAFLTVLGIIPRLTQLTKTGHLIHLYEWSVIISVVSAGWYGFYEGTLKLPSWILVPIGLANGVFIGMLAAALTEVLNVFPILSKRIGMERQLIILLMGLVFGKVLGALFHWFIFLKY